MILLWIYYKVVRKASALIFAKVKTKTFQLEIEPTCQTVLNLEADKFKVNGVDPVTNPECKFSNNTDTQLYTASFDFEQCGIVTSSNETDLIYRRGLILYSV